MTVRGRTAAYPLTWLYAPGDRPRVVAKALLSGADVVIVDLEDAVAPDRKDYARAATADLLADPELGPIRMQNVLFRLSDTPGGIRWAGRPHGADTEEVLTAAGFAPAEISALRAQGAV